MSVLAVAFSVDDVMDVPDNADALRWAVRRFSAAADDVLDGATTPIVPGATTGASTGSRTTTGRAPTLRRRKRRAKQDEDRTGVEGTTTQPVHTSKERALKDRVYDGLVKKPGGSWEGIEGKSGTSKDGPKTPSYEQCRTTIPLTPT